MKSKKLQIALISCVLAIISVFVYCSTTFINTRNTTTNQAVTRTIEVTQNSIDYEAYFEQFDSVEFTSNEKVSTLNLVQTIDEEFLSEINNASSTNHYKGEVCYEIEYDHENNKVYLNSTLYLDDEDNCLFDKVEGIACWNEKINDIDIVFEAEDDVIYLSDLNENINNCGWFKKALKFIKKHAVAIIATVAIVAVVATVAVAAPAFVAAATATISVGGGTAGLAGGISAGLVAAGSAIASSTLVSATVAAAVVTTDVVLSACLLDDIITLTEAYVLDFAESVRETNREDRYILVVLSALDQPLVTHYKPVSLETAKTWFSLGGQVWTPYSSDAIALIESCGYLAGDSKQNIGVPERNILPNGLYGNWHFHAIDPNSKIKIRLPGDGQNANIGKAHTVHCFFQYIV